MKITLRGATEVFKNHLEDDQEDVTDLATLKEIASKNDQLQTLYDAEISAFSQYCHDGSDMANEVIGALDHGGWVSLVFDTADEKLYVETTYDSSRDLTDEEIQFLVRETLGQWSDGAGGAAMDDFSEFIEPYYVELSEFEEENVQVKIH